MSTYVNSSYNIVNVNPNNTNVIEVITPGPQGPPGDTSNLTGSFVSTSSFNAFTSSYNTGSFTGSFVGNGIGLRGIISSSYSVTASFAQNFNPSATASYASNAALLDGKNSSVFATTGSNQFNGNQIITGSLTVSGSNTFTNIGPATFSGSVTFTTASTNNYIAVEINNNNNYIRTSGNDFYIINSTPNKSIKLSSDVFIVENYSTQKPVLTVSQSIVQFATQSYDPTGSTQVGSIWFTSSSVYVGLE
jgi:hypothetical protein